MYGNVEIMGKNGAHYKRTKMWRENNPWFRPLEYARRRCSDENHKSYNCYGGRGVTCSLTSKEAKILYARDNGHLLKQPSLDRKDPDGHYCFENCKYIEFVDNVAKRRPNGTATHHIDDKPKKEEDWEE